MGTRASGLAAVSAGAALAPAADVEQRLLGWLARYGLQAVFGLQVLGVVGLPVPDELLLTIAGALARSGKFPLAGTLTAIAAGSSGLGYGQFAAYAYSGAILWASFFVTVGYVLGEGWHRSFEVLRHHVRGAIVVAALAYGAYLAVACVRWYLRQRQQSR